jgi:hypothetical protein
MAQDEVIRDWDDLIALHRRHFPFEPGPSYDPATDMLHVAIADVDGGGSDFDEVLWVSRSCRTGAVTSFALCSVRARLLPIIRSLGLDRGQQLTVGVFLFAELISRAEQPGQPTAGEAEALRALSELCRVAGRMKVEAEASMALTPPASS